jgi:hypothetical protein
MRTRKHLHKWQRQRLEHKQRCERVQQLRAEVDRLNWIIGRLDPQEHHRDVIKFTARIRTLEQRIRYINADYVD